MQQQKLPRPLILSEEILQMLSVHYKAYSSMVRPIIEYCSTVWDPHFLSTKANCKMGNVWSISVTSMLELLQWPILSNHRYTSRLYMFYKSVYHLIAVQVATTLAIHPTISSSTLHCAMHACDYYKYSFFSKNNLRLEQFIT